MKNSILFRAKSFFFQVGNRYLEFDNKNWKADNNKFADGDVLRLVNSAFAYTLNDARIYSSSGVEIEQNKIVGPISTFMRLDTQKDGDLSTYFDINDESEAEIDNSSLKQILINNHSDDNKAFIKGHLPLDYFFGFCKSIKKITKGLAFELDLRTSNRKQDNLHTFLGDNDVNVTINSFSLFIPQIIPSPETQGYFKEDNSKTSTWSYESWTTDRKLIDTAKEFQIDISSASNINSPLYSIAAHQMSQRPNPTNPAINLPNNRFKNAISDHFEVRKDFLEIDRLRYPKNPIMINYLDKYRGLKLFFREYFGEPMLTPIITYDKMKDFFPFQINGLRFQVDHISPKKKIFLNNLVKIQLAPFSF